MEKNQSSSVHATDDAPNTPVVRRTFYTKYGKRIIDLSLASCAAVVLSPVFAIVAALELIFHGRPIFFTAQRPGKDEKLFVVRKFRSMTNETDAQGVLLPDKDRVNAFGRFLRRSSLDELPQLLSIIKGDMSIVGPRPLKEEYLPLYTRRHRMRHLIRPGLALVKLRKKGELGIPPDWAWSDQFENDIWYMEHCSLPIDIQMVWAIAKATLVGDDRRTEGSRKSFSEEAYGMTAMTIEDANEKGRVR